MTDHIVHPEPAPAPVVEDTPIRPSPDVLKAALDEKREFLLTLPAEHVVTHIKLDPSNAAGVVIGALPRIVRHRAEIGEQFGAEGLAHVDGLATAAYACEQADTESRVPEDGAEMAARAQAVLTDHNLLETELDSLANRKLIDRARIEPGRPIQGYRTIVKSTLVLVELYRAAWPQIGGKTFVTPADLDQIADRAKSMLDALNLRDGGSRQGQAIELRGRALSHLVTEYEEVRRMLTYVRWHFDDADDIAPSLFANRRRGRSRKDDGEQPSAPAPASPIDPIPGSGGAPFTS